MTTNGATKPGRLESALTRLFMKRATVTRVQVLSEHFRRFTLSGDALRDVRWTPGQKVQVAVGGWAYRTYTPLTWDATRGETELVVFLHGEAPGAAWGRTLKEGDECTLFGPRQSLDLASLERPALLFGDETSFGLACALRSAPGGSDRVRLLFEVTDLQEAKAVVSELGLADAVLVERKPNDAHLPEVEAVATTYARTDQLRGGVLSGKAPSLQFVNKQLRSLGLTGLRTQNRAYWAPGKVGLD